MRTIIEPFRIKAVEPIRLTTAEEREDIPPEQFPGQAIVVGLYRLGGIRAVEIGSVMFGGAGHKSEMELVRLAIPRRVYTQSHIDYVAEAVVELYQSRAQLRGLRIVEEPPTLRHFRAEFEEI